MKVACLVEPGTIEMREMPDPRPGPGEVVVRVERALTCGTDLKAYLRGHPFIPMPGTFGHQACGTIAAVGDGVEGFPEGTPVWGVLTAPCLDCSLCRRGRYSMCPGLKDDIFFAAFAQYLKLPPRVVAQNLLVRPPDVPPTTGAFLEPVSCVVHGFAQLDLERARRILVIGLGSMGLLYSQLLQRDGGVAVVGVDRSEERLAVARSYGLDGVIDIRTAPLDEQLAAQDPFDCVIECTGRVEGWQAAFDAVAPGGEVLMYGGLPRGTKLEIDTYRLHYEEISVHGCFHFGPPDVRAAAERISRGDLRLDGMLAHDWPLERLQEALDRMAAGEGIKYSIDPWG